MTLPYQQYKVEISGSHFFPFVSFAIFTFVAHKFDGKVLLSLLINCRKNELICQVKDNEI